MPSAPPLPLEREATDAEDDEEGAERRIRRRLRPAAAVRTSSATPSTTKSAENTVDAERSTAHHAALLGRDEHPAARVLQDVVDGLPEDGRLARRQIARAASRAR